MTFDEWAARLRQTVRLHQSMGFVIGDLLVYGEEAFGEEAYQVIDAELHMAPQTIANWMNVCRAIPPAVRTFDVPFSVYAEVAPVYRQDAQEGARLLSQAEAEGLSRSAVRAIVAPSQAVEMCRCDKCGKEHRP